MATWTDVARLALALPETSERRSRELRQWRVADKLFVWERPLRPADLQALGSAAPGGPVLGARVDHEGVKHALIQREPAMYFTTPHFDGYAAILVQLEQISLADLAALVQEAWFAAAPRRLARAQA